ncbi:MAG TPA: L-threonylcarbamoyladenylate synthase [Acidiferrobacteraceae bacterium]|nr:L-threonylcarbamoyladenylate synthase [Acidiferrobacteraceae bacterium]
MAQYFRVHPLNPQLRLIRGAADIVNHGGIVAYPTDSGYALGCQVGNKEGVDRIRRLRGLPEDHYFTLICRDLSELSGYARVDNAAYRFLKAHTPGPYTFVLPASREVPRRLQHPKRRTIGLRVPQHAVVAALLEALDGPLLSVSLTSADDPAPEPEEIRKRWEHAVDLVLDAGSCAGSPTTVVELDADGAHVVRVGQGEVAPLLAAGSRR